MNRAQRAVEDITALFDNKMIRILDVGCGFGETLALLGQAGFKNMVGIDISSDHLNRAQQVAPKATLMAGDAQMLPFSEHSFDVVIALDVIEHIPNDVQAVREMYRVLKSGGRLIITVPHYGYTRFVDPANVLYKITGRKEYHRHYTARQLLQLIGHRPTNLIVEKRGAGVAQVVHIITFPVRKLFKRPTIIDQLVRAIEEMEYTITTGDLGYHLFVAVTKTPD